MRLGITKFGKSCVLIMSHTRFGVNLHSVVAWMSREFLFEKGAISGASVTATGANPQPLSSKTNTQNHLVLLNSWVFVYKLSGCEFESRYSQLNLESQRCIWLFLVMNHSFSTNAIFFRKTNISYPLIRSRTCEYHGKRHVNFSEIFTYVLHERSLSFEYKIKSPPKACLLFLLSIKTSHRRQSSQSGEFILI